MNASEVNAHERSCTLPHVASDLELMVDKDFRVIQWLLKNKLSPLRVKVPSSHSR